jgi:hypothetical protein
VGTIFENTKVSLKKWFTAIYFVTNHIKGISSCQLARDLGVTQKTAWMMLHKLRNLQGTEIDLFDGETEIDETYLGGKEKNRHMKDRIQGIKDKTTVLGMVNRDTKQAKAVKVENTQYQTIEKHILGSIKGGKSNSTIITDESSIYKFFGKYFFDHKTVNHSIGEYARMDGKTKVTTNTVEGYFSLVKRIINGTYHFVSEKHLDRYLNEISYRYNSKSIPQYVKFSLIFDNLHKKLPYKKLIA